MTKENTAEVPVEIKDVTTKEVDETLTDYANELRVLVDKSNDSFEKQLNFISAGALGVSMLIIEKIVKDLSTTRYNILLILSWFFLGATLISNLLSHIYTSNVHSKTIVDINESRYDYEKAKVRNDRIKNWNKLSIFILLIGISLNLIFISYNIPIMSKDREIKPGPKPDETRGFPAVAPPKPGTGRPSSPPPASPPPPKKP